MELKTSLQVRQEKGDKLINSLKILMKHLCVLLGEHKDDYALNITLIQNFLRVTYST